MVLNRLTELSPIDEQTDRLRLSLPNVTAILSNQTCGSGVLLISEQFVSWQAEDRQTAFQIDYPSISLHAVTSYSSPSLDSPSIYLMIQSDSDELIDSSECDPIEMHFLHADKDSIDQVFQVIKNCQMLHPDPEDSVDEDFEGEDDYMNGNSFGFDINYADNVDLIDEDVDEFGDELDEDEDQALDEMRISRMMHQMSTNADLAEPEESLDEHLNGQPRHEGQFEDAD